VKKETKKRKLQFDDGKSAEVKFDAKTNMQVNTFNVLIIIDQLMQELNHRLEAYRDIEDKFGLKKKMKTLSHAEVQEKTRHLQSIYCSDLEDNFPTECCHFKHFLPNNIPLNSIVNHTAVHSRKRNSFYIPQYRYCLQNIFGYCGNKLQC
jgi:hypothetical protein